MIKINSLNEVNETSSFDDDILQKTLIEMNKVIKDNAGEFRLIFDLPSTSYAFALYKNSIVSYFLLKGFKTVIYPDFIYLDWSKTDVFDKGKDCTITDMRYIGDYFDAQEIYLTLTMNADLRNLSSRKLYFLVLNQIKTMNMNETDVISVGISTPIDKDLLNKMFAPEIYQLNKSFPDTEFTFISGGLFQIKLNSQNINYTDLPEYVLFGTRPTVNSNLNDWSSSTIISKKKDTILTSNTFFYIESKVDLSLTKSLKTNSYYGFENLNGGFDIKIRKNMEFIPISMLGINSIYEFYVQNKMLESSSNFGIHTSNNSLNIVNDNKNSNIKPIVSDDIAYTSDSVIFTEGVDNNSNVFTMSPNGSTDLVISRTYWHLPSPNYYNKAFYIFDSNGDKISPNELQVLAVSDHIQSDNYVNKSEIRKYCSISTINRNKLVYNIPTKFIILFECRNIRKTFTINVNWDQ